MLLVAMIMFFMKSSLTKQFPCYFLDSSSSSFGLYDLYQEICIHLQLFGSYYVVLMPEQQQQQQQKTGFCSSIL